MRDRECVDLRDIIEQARLRPSMFAKSLDHLEAICHGYSVALSVHDIDEFGRNFNQRFGEYLYRRFRWSMCKGWAFAIESRTQSIEKAFERFFKLVDQFESHSGH
jgi:hypothetical protein